MADQKNLRIFYYTGPATNGERIDYLTHEEALEYEKRGKEMQEQQEQDAKLGPALNQQFRSAGMMDTQGKQSSPLGELPAEAGQQAAPPVQGQPQDPIAAGLDGMAKRNQDAGMAELESAAMDTAGMSDGAAALTRSPQGPMGGMASGDESTTPQTQQQGIMDDLRGMYPDVPEKDLKRLAFDWKTQRKKASAVYDELAKIQDAMDAQKNKKAEKEYETQFAIDQKRGEEGITQPGKVELEKMGNDSAERIARINAAARAADTAAKNAYTERTFAMKPNQIENVNSYDVAINQLNAVKNLSDEKFVGQAKGRVGSFNQWLGTLGDEEATFRSAIAEFENELLKLRSGAAVTENEYKRFKKEVANTNVSPDQFLATLNRNIISLQNKKSIYLTGLKKAKYDIGEFESDIIPVENYEGGLNEKPASGGSAVSDTATIGDDELLDTLFPARQ